jgi:hypothetical protein
MSLFLQQYQADAAGQAAEAKWRKTHLWLDRDFLRRCAARWRLGELLWRSKR